MTDAEPEPNIRVNRLTLDVCQANGSFNFRAFPDTGSAATLIAADLARKNNLKATKPSKTKYISVNGDPVPTAGTAPVNLSTSGRHISTSAVITPTINNEIIIGQQDLKGLGVIPKQFPAPIFIVPESRYEAMREDLIQNNTSVLTDEVLEDSMNTGCVSMKIHLTPGEKMPFRISTAGQIPLHWREKAEKIINKLITEKVIQRQDDPTEWCAPGFFVTKKSGDLRLVIDYTWLNKYVKHPVHTFPSAQEILSGIDPNSKEFDKLDTTQGYHQVPLDEESSKLTTFLLESCHRRIFDAIHELAYPSGKATLAIISRAHAWRNMRRDVLQWARQCQACTASKVAIHARPAIQPILAPKARFGHVHLDIVGPFSLD